MTETINAFQMAQRQFDHVAGQLNMDPQVAEILRWPSREFKFQVPVRMDDGSIRLSLATESTQRCARTEQRGNSRLHPSETLDTVRALAMWMTWKCAVADISAWRWERRGAGRSGAL